MQMIFLHIKNQKIADSIYLNGSCIVVKAADKGIRILQLSEYKIYISSPGAFDAEIDVRDPSFNITDEAMKRIDALWKLKTS